MINDLRKYDCLGTPTYFFELLNIIKNNSSKDWNHTNLEKFFFNRVIDNRPIIDGGIDLAARINLLHKSGSSYRLNSDFESYLQSVSHMIDKFNQFLFEALKNDMDFLGFFNSKYLSHDIIYKSLQIDNSAFGFKYSNFKQLLLDFKIILDHPNPEFNSYILNHRYKNLFDKIILPEVKNRKMSVDGLRKSMELQQMYGEEAERFVLKYETERLLNKKKIDWVAEYVVNQGYDIASYNLIEDEIPNRFIEVKSYDGPKPYFYWSRNEYQVARIKGNEYWIYLVNRSRTNDENYSPEKIQNPFLNILGDHNTEWIEEVDKYKITANK